MKNILMMGLGLCYAIFLQGQTYNTMHELPDNDSRRTKSDAYKLPMHTNYAGKIVFSTQKLTLDGAKESMFKNSFNAGEPIYGRIFLKQPVINYMCYDDREPSKKNEHYNSEGYYSVKYYLDGELVQNSVLEHGNNDGDYAGRNTWQLFIAAKGEDASENNQSFIGRLNNLSDGTHTIKLEVYGGDRSNYETIEPIAKGEFTLNKTAGSSVKTGLNWASFAEGMVNSEVKSQALSVAATYAKNKGWTETVKATKIKSQDWSVFRADNGAITRRVLEIYVLFTGANGNCSVRTIDFEQTYLGGGSYSKTLVGKGYSEPEKIDCQ